MKRKRTHNNRALRPQLVTRFQKPLRQKILMRNFEICWISFLFVDDDDPMNNCKNKNIIEMISSLMI